MEKAALIFCLIVIAVQAVDVLHTSKHRLHHLIKTQTRVKTQTPGECGSALADLPDDPTCQAEPAEDWKVCPTLDGKKCEYLCPAKKIRWKALPEAKCDGESVAEEDTKVKTEADCKGVFTAIKAWDGDLDKLGAGKAAHTVQVSLREAITRKTLGDGFDEGTYCRALYKWMNALSAYVTTTELDGKKALIVGGSAAGLSSGFYLAAAKMEVDVRQAHAYTLKHMVNANPQISIGDDDSEGLGALLEKMGLKSVVFANDVRPLIWRPHGNSFMIAMDDLQKFMSLSLKTRFPALAKLSKHRFVDDLSDAAANFDLVVGADGIAKSAATAKAMGLEQMWEEDTPLLDSNAFAEVTGVVDLPFEATYYHEPSEEDDMSKFTETGVKKEATKIMFSSSTTTKVRAKELPHFMKVIKHKEGGDMHTRVQVSFYLSRAVARGLYVVGAYSKGKFDEGIRNRMTAIPSTTDEWKYPDVKKKRPVSKFLPAKHTSASMSIANDDDKAKQVLEWFNHAISFDGTHAPDSKHEKAKGMTWLTLAAYGMPLRRIGTGGNIKVTGTINSKPAALVGDAKGDSITALGIGTNRAHADALDLAKFLIAKHANFPGALVDYNAKVKTREESYHATAVKKSNSASLPDEASEFRVLYKQAEAGNKCYEANECPVNTRCEKNQRDDVDGKKCCIIDGQISPKANQCCSGKFNGTLQHRAAPLPGPCIP